ncbi:TetR/AcrR family transcriptional regulator [Saccharothrix coeruleofusca]|uniref:TetR family transcriptional regulator n=1 Tax=Saccharothrix coeruleofusca TaxID=33919 RepID=A0A918AKP2_9PSEU|nr:TetR/AcrR family transcriptional regulator [Saccharothrix coeruleofusca]GGP49897.1 TetR family transcriptional regulator [Saccharothrix coeruleofusca]
MGGREAEARRNDARVLAAASAVFEELGDDAPVSAIARRAGVGMGSLYRRYPTKEVLVHDVCLAALQRVADLAESALRDDDAWGALERVLRGTVESGATKLLGLRRTRTDDLRAAAERAGAALERLVERARAEGGLREGVSAGDLLHLARLVTGAEPGLRERYLALVLDGLRARLPLPGPAPEWGF